MPSRAAGSKLVEVGGLKVTDHIDRWREKPPNSKGLKEKLTKVVEWEKRKAEIEEQLGKVWVEGADVLDPPSYNDGAAAKEGGDETSETQT